MDMQPPHVLVTGDWGIHRFQFGKNRAESDSGAKLYSLALDKLITVPHAIFEHLSVQPTLPEVCIPLELLPKQIDGVTHTNHSRLRILGSTVESGQSIEQKSFQYASKAIPNYNVAVIHDAGGLWRSRTTASEIIDIANKGTGPIFIHICGTLPNVERNALKGSLSFASSSWAALDSDGIRERVHVICSITPIREAGCAVSRRLSWEQTVEDLAAELFLCDQLRALSRFNRLTIRLGHVAAVYLDIGGRLRSGKLIFSPEARNGIHRDPEEDGRVIGKNLLLTSSLVNCALSKRKPQLAQPDVERSLDDVTAICTSMRSSMDFFDCGYKKFENDLPRNEIYQAIWSMAPDLTGERATGTKKEKNFVSIDIPCAILRRPPGVTGLHSNWEILRDQVNLENEKLPEEQTPNRINIGTAIVLFGAEHVLNRSLKFPENKQLLQILHRPPCRVTKEEPSDVITLPPQRKPAMPDADAIAPPATHTSFNSVQIITPIAKVGHLVTVEREDIESIRSIQNLIKTHLHDFVSLRNEPKRNELKPLSIAVFGPPGSGKSFAVKQIVASINPKSSESGPNHEALPSIKVLSANLSEFHGVNDLERLFLRVQACLAENMSMPLVFFDEFDTEHFDKTLGWLKHFLAPMQDGKFGKGGEEIELYGAVFVFAGGTFSRFQDFDPSEPPGVDRVPADSKELQERMQRFKELKGPDFVSRLRGHMNVYGVDAPDGQTKHVIRRALALHAMWSALRERTARTRKHIRKNNAPKAGDAPFVMRHPIDEDVIYALLTVDRYRHGARSMEAVLSMCARIDGNIQKVSLPSRQQLNMHVDADEFFVRMHRSRFRRQLTGDLPREGYDRDADSEDATNDGQSAGVISSLDVSTPDKAGNPPFPSTKHTTSNANQVD